MTAGAYALIPPVLVLDASGSIRGNFVKLSLKLHLIMLEFCCFLHAIASIEILNTVSSSVIAVANFTERRRAPHFRPDASREASARISWSNPARCGRTENQERAMFLESYAMVALMAWAFAGPLALLTISRS